MSLAPRIADGAPPVDANAAAVERRRHGVFVGGRRREIRLGAVAFTDRANEPVQPGEAGEPLVAADLRGVEERRRRKASIRNEIDVQEMRV